MQLSEAVAKLHELNICHLNVSPSNALRTLSGYFKLTDFGIAVTCDTPRGTTQQPHAAGNVSYMAPEQGKSDARITNRADIWAFGATMLRAWTGGRPYARLSQHQCEPPPLDGLARPLPPELRGVLDLCFLVEPTERPAAHELHHMLKATRRRTLVRFSDSELPAVCFLF